MPCRSDDLEDTKKETEAVVVCQLLCYLLPMLAKSIPSYIRSAQTDRTLAVAQIDDNTALLCSTIQEMSEEQQNRLIYDGRNSKARKLADWWKKHQRIDVQHKEENQTYDLALTKTELESLNKLFSSYKGLLATEFTKIHNKISTILGDQCDT